MELEKYIITIDRDNLDQLHPEYCDKMAMLDLEEVNKLEEIKNSHSAHEAQKIRFKYEDKIKLNSNEILELMEKILRCKIEQNPYVLKKLLETKNYIIVEDSPKDNYWGWGINRDGENHLGKI